MSRYLLDLKTLIHKQIIILNSCVLDILPLAILCKNSRYRMNMEKDWGSAPAGVEDEQDGRHPFFIFPDNLRRLQIRISLLIYPPTPCIFLTVSGAHICAKRFDPLSNLLLRRFMRNGSFRLVRFGKKWRLAVQASWSFCFLMEER